MAKCDAFLAAGDCLHSLPGCIFIHFQFTTLLIKVDWFPVSGWSMNISCLDVVEWLKRY